MGGGAKTADGVLDQWNEMLAANKAAKPESESQRGLEGKM